MKISRSGHGTSRGTRSIAMAKPRVSWKASTKRIEIRDRGVDDFTGRSQHDYVVELALNEVSIVLTLLGTDGLRQSFDHVVEGLEPALRGMLRICNAQTQVQSDSVTQRDE